MNCNNCGKELKLDEKDYCAECRALIILAVRKKARAEQEARELKRQQDLELAKKAELAELARKQRLHGDNSLEVNDQETSKLPNFEKISNVRIGFWGEYKPCSGYIMRYGQLGAIPTKIYLTFNYSKDKYLADNYLNYQVNYIPSGEVKSFCARCSKEILNNWSNIINYDYYQQSGQADKELAEAKNRIRERDKELS